MIPSRFPEMGGNVDSMSKKKDPNKFKEKLSKIVEERTKTDQTGTAAKPHKVVVAKNDSLVGRIVNMLKLPFGTGAKNKESVAALVEQSGPVAKNRITAEAFARQAAQKKAAIDKAHPKEPLNESVEVEFARILKEGTLEEQCKLGKEYQDGKKGIRTTTKECYEKAKSLYEAAAKKGSSQAECNLGYLYEIGLGVSEDLQKAKGFYQRAVEKKSPEAQYRLGIIFCYAPTEIDYEKARTLLRSSADQGFAYSQTALGAMYEEGMGGSKNLKAAMELYIQAAGQGDIGGEYRLARMYENGIWVNKDSNKAAELYKKAADKNDDDSQYALGYMYEKGSGVTTDLKVAKEWYQRAADQGNEEAKKALDRLNNA